VAVKLQDATLMQHNSLERQFFSTLLNNVLHLLQLGIIWCICYTEYGRYHIANLGMGSALKLRTVTMLCTNTCTKFRWFR